jgi:hypothetical protein
MKRRLNTSLLLFALAASLLIPVYAHLDRTKPPGPKEIEAHWRADFGFPGFHELNVELERDFWLFDNDFNRLQMDLAAQEVPDAASPLVGSWSPVFTLPIVPIHVMLLTNGKLLMWDSVGDNPTESYPEHTFTRAAIWDPATNLVTRVDNTATGYNLFCAGFAHLPNGTPFIAGGNLNSEMDGIDKIHFFNQTNNSWSRGPNMTQGGRWYPSATPLANGEMLITSGGPATPEVYTTSGALRALSSVTWTMPLYPWLQASTNGRALFFGPTNTLQYITTSGSGSLTNIGARDGINRSYGSYAMYDIGKIVASGGSTSSKKTVMLDVTNPNVNPVVTVPADMAFGRRQHNLTVLPDGTVLATGGISSGSNLVDLNAAVLDAELWSPMTRTWKKLSRAQRIRQYHSTAILLPDGRVFTGGGGICGACQSAGYLEKNYEIFTPPYLYKTDGSGQLATRPTIASAPSAVVYDQSFSVSTPEAAQISQAVMMRVSSVTHSVDFEQRRAPLRFSRGTGTLSVDAPPNSNTAPPGYYMLFLIDSSGVPSVAKMIRLDHGTGLGAPMITAMTGGNRTATLNWIPVSGATSYTVKYGTAPGTYTNTINAGNVTRYTIGNLTAPRYYFAVSASTSSQTGGDSNEVSMMLIPTAARVTISGRVTAPDGFGLSGVHISMTGDDPAQTGSVVTNPFGHYSFDNIEAGRNVVITVSSKRYSFPRPSLFLNAVDNISNADFVGDNGP